MAGPAPKDPAQRRRRNEPARGEWTDLPPLTSPVLPPLPKRPRGTGKWPAATAAAWAAWRADPASVMFGPADIAAAFDVLALHEQFALGDTRIAAEIRLRLDGLGLSQKGKRDLRWRVAPPGEVVAMPTRSTSARERMRKLSERAAGADSVAG